MTTLKMTREAPRSNQIPEGNQVLLAIDFKIATLSLSLLIVSTSW